MKTRTYFSKSIAAALACLWPCVATAQVTADSIAPTRPSAPILWRPYLPADVPPVRLNNSNRMRDLIRAGKLYLTAQDAIALALENNIDIEVARYTPLSLEWSLERAQAGGALPGVPSGATASNSVASGQGVLGSQAAAGVSNGGNANNRSSGNTTITQVGPVAQTFDPSIQGSTAFSHKTLPQFDQVQTFNPVLIDNARVYSTSYQQGFLSGGSVNVSYNNHYLNENAITDVLNPSVAPTLSVSLQQNLLQGFGAKVGGRQIEVAKINLRTSDLNFRSQLITTIVNVLNAYYALVGDYENVKAKQSARDVAQNLLEDSRKQVQIGSLADIDLITSESQVASTGQDLVNAQVALDQQSVILKNLISRTGIGDPLIASVEIVPLDRIVMPPDDNDIPAMRDLVTRAAANRNDLQAETASLQSTEISNLGTRSGLLPSLQLFASTSNAGTAGSPHPANIFGFQLTPDAYFVGGLGKALGQIFRRDFPSENAGFFASVPLKNRQAQADFGIDQLSLRQQQLANAKDLKQNQVDILNSVVALRQARARYDAAAHARVLDAQLLESEQKKFGLGASTPYNVIQQQRDLVAAQATEIAALVSYSNARVNLDQTLGATLETNHVSIAGARAGRLAQASVLPANLPQ